MFGHFKNFLRRLVETPAEATTAPANAAGSTRQIVMAPRAASEPPPNNGGHHNGRGIELPLQPIISGLPLELQPRLLNGEVDGMTISVPLEKILAQLSRGAVQIPFGDLRQAAPELFTEENDRDRVMVPLPLGEILSRLNPALITRRRVQKQVEIPAEISSPFDQRSQSLIFSVGPTAPGAASPPTAAPPPRQVTVPMPATAPSPARSGLSFVPTPPPPAATPPATPAISSPARALRDLGGSQPPVPHKIAAAPKTPPPASPAPESMPLMVSLISLAESWPESVRQELVQLNLVDARVALPTEVVERALKQGRVAFTWKTLRSWITPAPLPVVSVHDTSVLELPLKVVAPPFLARQKEATRFQKKVSVDDEIPNLFFGFPRPESGSATVASASAGATGVKSADTNFYVWDDASDTARVQEDDSRRGPSPGTKFVAKYATPNEVVSRASSLDGVAGALIALPDGLMVASCLSPDLNGDTLAAFLPQIFAKVNQCTKELRMGDLNNVNFTVGNVPWKIFRVNAIFFAAFGRAGEPLPTAQLAALAVELDHNPK